MLSSKHYPATGFAVLALLFASETVLASEIIIDNVVVTASGRAQSIDSVQTSVQVVDRDDIDRYGGHSAAEVLQQAIGVQTKRSGAVTIRGFKSNQSLVLVDGQRRTGSYGTNDLRQINMTDVERIEIVRGPMSSLYGADALGGVVNVIKKHPGVGAPVRLQSTVGTAKEGRETIHSGATFNFNSGQVGHALSLEQKYRNSMREHDTREERIGTSEAYSAGYRGHWQANADASVQWSVEYYDHDSNRAAINPRANPSDYTAFDDERRNYYSLDYAHLLGAGELRLHGSYGRATGEANRSYPNPVEVTLHEQYQTSAVYQWLFNSRHNLHTGAGYIRDELALTINSQDSVRDNYFVLAQDEWDISDNWMLVFGARHDRVDDAYHVTTPRLSLGWNGGAAKARLGYGEGFRAPTLIEQYSRFNRGNSVIQGNPNLQPEKSQSWELMLGYGVERFDLEATGYYSDVDDLIDTQRIEGSEPTTFEYSNVQKARIMGVELNANVVVAENLTLNLGYDWLDAEDATTNVRLEERTKHTYRAQLNYQHNDWTVTLRGRYMQGYYGKSSECLFNCVAYDSNFNIADVNVQYRVSEKVELVAGVDNFMSRTEPDNFITWGSGKNDPGERYYYSGIRVVFN